MSLLSQKLSVGVNLSQKQILTPGLMQLVTVLQLNHLELKDMIIQEINQNPVLEESTELGEDLTPGEIQELLEAERVQNPSDKALLEAVNGSGQESGAEVDPDAPAVEIVDTIAEPPPQADPFDEIDFGSYFDDYLDPGHKAPAGENSEKPSYELFLSSPITLSDHLGTQLSLTVLAPEVRDAADSIIGNLDECGYLTMSLDDLASEDGHTLESLEDALRAVQALDPAGVGARTVQECLLLQLESRADQSSLAWTIVKNHLGLVESRHYKELARILDRPPAHIEVAIQVILHLDPKPGLRYSGPGARQIEPDVHIFKDGEDYVIQLNDDDIPQIRINRDYRRMLEKGVEPDRDTRAYIREKFSSALQLMKNIEQRKQTIRKVCELIVGRQREFLESGITLLRPMMIKDLAEEIGVHASTVSRAVANKFAHTPQGVFELRFFFSEAVQGSSGADTSLVVLKLKVKKMIADEDLRSPLTDEQITARLQSEGIDVTRRTVAKYREDMAIPSTHKRRLKD